jgi:hypothetical protein
MDHPDDTLHLKQQVEDLVRREPARTVASAFGVGFLINLLPIAAIAALLVSMAFSLLRPVLLFLGFVKACEICRLISSSPSEP